jgi:DNA (cytosine-5)-methyltransferase 1
MRDSRFQLQGARYIDLFAGIGGFHQAMNAFGAECVFASEWDKDCQAIYQANYGIQPVGDITKIAAEDIPEHEVLCAGFPCQAFSISGKQLGFQDTRGTLFFDVARIAKHHQPKLLLLENVKNFARHDEGRTLQTVESVLQELGYTVFHQVLNASHFGVPQKRERIYILAFRNDLGIQQFTFPTSADEPKRLIDACLPDTETDALVIQRDDIQMKESVNVEADMLGNYPQKPIRIGTVNKGGQGERIYHPYGHAVTLSAYGGGVGAKTGLYLINHRIRRLAPRECARISGFPDTFQLSANRNVSYRQFGNTVVVNVLMAILYAIEGIIEKSK